MGEVRRAVGLMSGTSMDGIDIALIETDGEDIVRRIASATYAYGREIREFCCQALAQASELADRDARPGVLGQVERRLTECNARAIATLLSDNGITPETIDLIGYHGQTVLHRPDVGLTVQLADGPLLAQLTGMPVIYDLRAADMEGGGQGAPLVPVYHRALASSVQERPLGILNIGGVANITWIGPDGELIAFDTGPGGALIDDWVASVTSGALAFDEGGEMASAGAANEDAVKSFLEHGYFLKSPPKSLDRNEFSIDLVEWMNPENGAATLTAISAEAIARGMQLLPQVPAKFIACGGGRKNAALLTMIAKRADIKVVVAEDIGLQGDSVEAEAWAYLAVRSRRGLPITFPGTTGVKLPLSGGVLALPSAPAA